MVRYLGAAYLGLLGVRALRSPGRAGPSGATPAPASRAKVFRDGVLVNLLNPKVALFFLAFLPQFLDPTRGSVAVQTLVLGLVLVTLGIASNLLYAFAAAALAGRVRAAGRAPGGARVRWVTGGVYLSLGAFAAVAGGRH